MEKTVKISISVDDAAFDKAKRKVAELVQEVHRLSEATSKISLFGGSGGAGIKIGNMPTVPGGGSVGTQTTHQASRSTGNAGTDAMTKAVTTAATAMKMETIVRKREQAITRSAADRAGRDRV